MHGVLPTATDRVEFLRYILTGALFEDEAVIIGSVIMCHENELLGVRQGFASCTPSYIHEHREADESYMSRFRKYFPGKVDLFMHHVRQRDSDLQTAACRY